MTRSTVAGNPTLQEALRLRDAGISVIPIGDNKLPAGWALPRHPDDETKGTWDPYKERLPTRDEVIRWFGGARRKHGIARVHGAVSGNLETLDFDVDPELTGLEHDAVVAEWEGLVEELRPGLLFRLTKIRTPRPGTHFTYRCEEPVEGNQKIAHAAELDPETRQPARDSSRAIKWKCFIESRGEGGYAVGPGTPANLHPQKREYEHVGGPPLHQVETITAEERMVLLNAARMLTRKASEDEPHRHGTNGHAGDRPGDDFNARTTWDEILPGYGWAKVSESGGVGKWKRPGGTSQWSATTNYGGHDLLHVFSTGLPIPAERSYNRFQFMTYMDHGGDFSAATKALAAKGYGTPLAGHATNGGLTQNGAATRSYKLTDLGNAERFRDAHGRNVRYCHPTGKWLVWDCTRWKADETGAVARLAKRTVRTIWSELGAIDDEERRKKLAQHAAKSESSARIAGLLSLAESEQGIPVLPDQLDRDVWALNTPSGTVDLRTGELRPHRREDLITKICPVPYDPSAQSDLWEKFIQRTFDGDAELIRFVQRWLGYRLTGTITEQKLPIFWGDGNNGKSTLLDTVVYVMGDYADEAPPQLLTERRGGDEHPTEIAGLQGKRLIVASETDKGRRLRLQLMKMLTGNARLRARFTKQDYFTFDRTFELVLVTNNKPKVREDTTAVWRRIRLVPFRVVIPKHEIDEELPNKLKAEAPAILRWLVEGCLEWQQHGLVEPQAVTLATGQYRAESDPLRDFLMECCAIDPMAWTKTSAVRKAYEEFCAERGDKPAPGSDFTDSLRQVGCQPERRHAGRGWLGIRLLADAPIASENFEDRF